MTPDLNRSRTIVPIVPSIILLQGTIVLLCLHPFSEFPRLSISPPHDEAVIASRESMYVDASRAAMWGLSVNVVLVVMKLTGGVITGSAALIADAVNSIGDVASAVAVRGALSVAQLAEDDDHPYGHSKAESIAGLCVALLVAFSAGLFGLETVKRFGGELTVPGQIAGVLAIVCAIIKETIYRYTHRVARRLDSSALRAAAWDHRSDAWASAAVGVTLIVAPYVGDAAPYVDPIAAVCVCVMLVITGIRIFSQTARELMDQQAGDDIVDRVREASLEIDGVQDVEKLRVRKSGLEYFIEIHIEVEGHITVAEGHRIGHNVKDQLMNEMPRVRDVHVHIEPYGA